MFLEFCSDAKEILCNTYSKDTVKSNKRAGYLLKPYIWEKGCSVEFEKLPSSELYKILKYKSGSIENFSVRVFDRILGLNKDNEFHEENVTFAYMLAMLKREGLGETAHYPQSVMPSCRSCIPGDSHEY